MVLVRKFNQLEMQRNSTHPEVEARYAVFERDGQTLVQINTYGSPTKQIQGMFTQTIQLDREGADALRAILDEAFPR